MSLPEKDGRVKVAVIGSGYWGKNLVRNFYDLGALDAVCEINPDIKDQLFQKFNDISIISDYQGILKNPDIEGVVIATPAATHYSLAKEALVAGKDVYVEKPLCLDESQAKELCNIAEETKRILMVGHLLHYHPAVRMIKEYIRGGKLGRLHHIYSNRLNLGIFRSEENVLWSFAPHDISVILSLLESMPQKVWATGTATLRHGTYDTACLIMDFPGGIKAGINVSWLHPFKEQRMVVAGEKGMIVFDDRSANEKLRYYREPVAWEGASPRPNKPDPEIIPIPLEEPLKNECAAFIEAVHTRNSPVTDGREGLRVLKILNAAQRSMDSGGLWQQLNDNRDKKYFAHSTAIIDDGCSIGDGTKIWHFSHVMAGAEIGRGCNIGQNVVVSPGVKLGANVKIQNNVSVYTGVVCEDDVFLGPSMVFTNVKTPRSHVNRRDQYEKTILRRGCSIGANATIVCGVEIGEYAMVGAGAVVTRDVPPYTLVAGNPARQMGRICQCGGKIGDGNTCILCGKQCMSDKNSNNL